MFTFYKVLKIEDENGFISYILNCEDAELVFEPINFVNYNTFKQIKILAKNGNELVRNAYDHIIECDLFSTNAKEFLNLIIEYIIKELNDSNDHTQYKNALNLLSELNALL